MARSSEPPVEGMSGVLAALKAPKGSLRSLYVDDPVALAERLHLKLPEKPLVVMQKLGLYDPDRHGPITPGIRDMVVDVCTGKIRNAVAAASRGGGKSMGVSFVEFFLVFMKDYDALNLGGSELQADQVYQYIMGYIESHSEFKNLIKGEPLQSKTETLNNAWIRVLTASSKSVRSPHAGGRKKDGRLAGGLLVIDEEAEAAPDIVEAALPTINTARPSVNMRVSTFHNAEGSFADVMDNAETMGYKKYTWDIFDVAERCDCTGDGCQSEEQCFRQDHVEEYIDPDTGLQATRMLHRAYCNGRAKYANGWIPMEEIVTLWKRFKRNHARWEVEAMGSRPSTKGYVIKDRTKYSENVTELDGDQLYLPGWPVTIVVDWGTIAAGLEVWQEQPGDNHCLIHCEQVEEAGDTQIIGKILSLRIKYESEFKEVAADIGGGGNYLNPKLRSEYGLPVRDVNFGVEKEAAVAAWNIFNEANKIKYPAEYTQFDGQVKKWKRKAGHIQKGNDHLMDAAICYFAAFIDRLGLNNITVAPRAFSAGGRSASQERVDSMRENGRETSTPTLVGAGAMVRTIGSRRR
jgi:hypothetical protein